MPSDGAIVIDTAINNSGFLRDARIFRSAVQGLKSTVDRVGAAMNRSGNSYGQALRSQAKDATELKRQLDALNDRYVAVVREMNQLQKSGGDAGRYRELAKEAQTLSAKMAELRRTGAGEALDKVAESAGRARTSIAAIAGGAVQNGFHKLMGVVQKLGKAIGSLFHRSRGSGNFFSVKNLLAYGLGIRSLYALFGRLRTAVKDGLGSLAEYDPRVRAAVNSMSAALSSLKGSLSTAFAPILTAVAPALITLINLLTRAVNAIGMFIAALTGQSFYTVAAGVSAVGGAAKGSSGAVKELKRQLAGFDELNILSDTSAGGGGGGGGGGGLGGLEYTKVPIADWLNEAIQNDNFALIGQKLAQKLNESLDKIDWDAIKRRAKDIVKKFTDILNGFIGEINPQSLGRTLAGVINTAAAIIGDFFDRTKWEDLGRVIKNSLLDALKRLSVNDIARALLAPIKAGINFLKGLLPETTPEWHQITGKLVAILVKAIQDFPAQDLGDVIGRLINGAFSLIKDLADARTLTKLAKKIGEAIQAAIKRIDLNLIKDALIAFLQDAWEALKVLIGLDLNIGGVNVAAIAIAWAASRIGKGILKLFGASALAKNGGMKWNGATLIGALALSIDAALALKDIIQNSGSMSGTDIRNKVFNIISDLITSAGLLIASKNPAAGLITIAIGIALRFDIQSTVFDLMSAIADKIGPFFSDTNIPSELKEGVKTALSSAYGETWDSFWKDLTSGNFSDLWGDVTGKNSSFAQAGKKESARQITTEYGLKLAKNSAYQSFQSQTWTDPGVEQFETLFDNYVQRLGIDVSNAAITESDYKRVVTAMIDDYDMLEDRLGAGNVTWDNFYRSITRRDQLFGDATSEIISQENQKLAGNDQSAVHIPTTVDPPPESSFQRVKQSIADWFSAKLEPVKAKIQAVLDDDNASPFQKQLASYASNLVVKVQALLEKGWSGTPTKALGVNNVEFPVTAYMKVGYPNSVQIQQSSGKATLKADKQKNNQAVLNALGGAFYSGFWHNIPQYARGTLNAGSLFVAGEAGPEIVGNIGGRTEVLNKSQLAATMFAAVRSAMQGLQVRVDLGEIASAGWMDKLAAHIGNYQPPAMASGSVLPYDVAAQIAKTGQDIQTTLDANTDDLIQTIISVAGQIVAALNRPQQTGGQSGATAQDVINEINRRTLMFGASPLQGV